MPRKTKETEKKEETKITKKSPKSTTKTTKKTSTTKNTNSKKSTTRKTTTTKKTDSKKSTTKKTTTTKKTSTTRKTTSKTVKKVDITPVEYYDLPYNYNKTVVKLLAQTPNTLFVYWEISEIDRENYKKTYGDNFFESTKPVLIIYNDTMNYSFEVEINDFANSWYIHVNDSKCDYRVELGRRFLSNSNNNENYIYVSNSNEIESPNDRVLFDQIETTVSFRNVKTNVETKKDISTLKFIQNMGKIYNIYDLYKEIYKNENIDELSNPSSSYKGDK